MLRLPWLNWCPRLLGYKASLVVGLRPLSLHRAWSRIEPRPKGRVIDAVQAVAEVAR